MSQVRLGEALRAVEEEPFANVLRQLIGQRRRQRVRFEGGGGRERRRGAASVAAVGRRHRWHLQVHRLKKRHELVNTVLLSLSFSTTSSYNLSLVGFPHLIKRITFLTSSFNTDLVRKR